ncbi:MAG: undecaprenyl-diphosphatase [Thermodesulforhabdaceae bacterium]
MFESINIELLQLVRFNADMHPIVSKLAVFFAQFGPYILLFSFALVWLFIEKPRRLVLVESIVAAVIGLVLNWFIGLVYYHPRPFLMGLCDPLFPHAPDASFPSDHATLLFSIALYVLLPKRWISFGTFCLAVAILTSWGRIYSCIHFPFDIVGSLMVGLISAEVAHFLAKPLNAFNKRLVDVVSFVTNSLKRTRA